MMEAMSTAMSYCSSANTVESISTDYDLNTRESRTKCDDRDMVEWYRELVRHSQFKLEREFASGSDREIYGQHEMLDNYGLDRQLLDRDVMCYFINKYAFPCRKLVPVLYNGDVIRIYSQGCHAGYTKLRYERDGREVTVNDIKEVEQELMHGPAEEYSGEHRLKDLIQNFPVIESSAYQISNFVKQDNVYAIHCPYWPEEALEWISRPRRSGSPPMSIIGKVLKYGCDFVCVSHKLIKDRNEWRFSFSKAELILIQSWRASLRIVYRTLHLLNKMIKSRNESSVLCSYYFKTMLLWASEEKPVEFWSEQILANSACELLSDLATWLKIKSFPNYFISANNMVDHLTDTQLSTDIEALLEFTQNTKLINNIIHLSSLADADEDTIQYSADMPMWIHDGLAIYNQIENPGDTFSNLFSKNFPTQLHDSLLNELFVIHCGLAMNKKASNCITNYKNYSSLALEYFDIYLVSKHTITCQQECGKEVFRSTVHSWFTDMGPFQEYEEDTVALQATGMIVDELERNGDHDDDIVKYLKSLLYKRCTSTIGDLVMCLDEALDLEIEQRPGLKRLKLNIDIYCEQDGKTFVQFYMEEKNVSPTVNISWFIQKSYLANLYHAHHSDCNTASSTCDNIIDVFNHSVGNSNFAERSFPLILSTDLTGIYDDNLQEMLGFFFICSFIYNKICCSRSVYLGVCSILFALYLKVRCSAYADESKETLEKCREAYVEHLEDCNCDDRVNNGRLATSTVVNVLLGEETDMLLVTSD